VIAVTWWLLRVDYVTKKHNRQAVREYRDLDRWVRDQETAQANALTPAADWKAVRDSFAQQWRDRRSASEGLLQDLEDSEHLGHRLWRRYVGREWPMNPHAEELALLTREWDRRIKGLREEALERARRGESLRGRQRETLLEALGRRVNVDEKEKRLETLGAALAELSESERIVLNLRFGEGMSVDEISRAWGATPTLIRSSYWKALRRLSEKRPADR
jgi:hypothetical protein